MRDLRTVLKEVFRVKEEHLDLIAYTLSCSVDGDNTDEEIAEKLYHYYPETNENIMEIYDVNCWLDADYFYMDCDYNIRLHPDAPEGKIPQPKGFKYYDYMFYAIGCDGGYSWDISDWDMSEIISTSFMFCECSALSVGDLSGWKLDSLFYAESMFAYTTVPSFGDLSNWDMSNAWSLNEMFHGCKTSNMGELAKWKLADDAEIYKMFCDCEIKDAGDFRKWELDSPLVISNVFMGAKYLNSGLTPEEEQTIRNEFFNRVKNSIKIKQGGT